MHLGVISVVFSNLGHFSSFCPYNLELLKITGQLFCRMSLNLGLSVFSYDLIKVILFWQEYHRTDVCFSQGIIINRVHDVDTGDVTFDYLLMVSARVFFFLFLTVSTIFSV